MPDHKWRKDPKLLRERVRNGLFRESTASLCPGFVQANLVMLPAEFALDFTIFCLRNPKPCPVLEILEKGDPIVKESAKGADIRTDIPMYNLYKNGELVDEMSDIKEHFRDDLVTFLIGCSYTFEEALVRGGVPVRNYLQGKDPGIYVTSVMCKPAGIFSGPMVVTMRPLPPNMISRAVTITSRFPKAHGAPVHIGEGSAIGVSDLSKTDFVDPPDVREGEVPVFWGCGITPQMIAIQSRVPFMITHKPCHMFMTDMSIDEMAE